MSCIGTSVLADVCKERVQSRTRSLGDGVADYLGADTELDKLEELLFAAPPTNAFQVELAMTLMTAARTLGFDVKPPERLARRICSILLLAC